MATYEIITRAFPREDGLMAASLEEALTLVDPGDEVWKLADDAQQTRILRVWPAPFGAGQ